MKYVKLFIDNDELELNSLEDLPISFNYQLEDIDNFEQKKGSESFNITVPATLRNDKIFNTYHNPSIEDLTSGQIFRSHRSCVILGNGYELLNGKAFLIDAKHTDRPTSYTMNCYGGNADWMIDLKEVTLFDVLQDVSFTFDKNTVMNSWNFDGMDETLPYVFAPIKYGEWLDTTDTYTDPSGNTALNRTGSDNNVIVSSMKPSISVYWILYKAFKNLGYHIQSEFFNTSYFRRAVMPWTWGNFLSSEGTKYEIHNFRARTTSQFVGGVEVYNNYQASGGMSQQYIDLKVSNDSIGGMFDNNNTVVNGDYNYIPGNNYEMQWKYNTPDFGPLEVTLSAEVSVDLAVTDNSNGNVYIEWFKNGTQMQVEQIGHAQAPYVTIGGATTDTGVKTSFFTANVVNGDIISCRVSANRFESKYGYTHMTVGMEQLQIDYFRIPLGGTISFDSYNGFKKVKFLDLFRGVIDTFNLSIATDSTNKMIIIEPIHGSHVNGQFFTGDYVDWNDKQDLNKESQLDLFSDYEREVSFKFKDDSNDGLLKLVQDRNLNVLGASKYVFPERFKSGKRQVENRFFSPVMHCELDQFRYITGDSPQFVVIVPENISNTSHSESQNTFAPKLCWYKGLTAGVGGWKFEGTQMSNLPFLFAVNYKSGGEADPVFSYSDEKIGTIIGSEVLAIGLTKRFFWQRFAIMRNGQFYTTYLHLNNTDAAKPAHREYKIIKGQKWELNQITDYKPLNPDSTKCFLKKWAPVSLVDYNFTFPSEGSVLHGNLNGSSFDIKYAQLKCLANDIPTPQ